ncbi:rhomboid family intramembrane serine protease [Candidatus Woesearchaeota archaeon]|nr:rhomboid family intramembrane serine protease [Candidatus Woesearchaeota archaeon]
MKYRLKSAVIPIIVANIAIFVLQIFLGNWFTSSFMLVQNQVFVRPWILLTSMFLHAGTFHIFFNMYVLLMFGSLVEQKLGPKRFLFIYFLAGILSGFVSSFIYPAALGASGAIMGILGVIIVLMPELQVLLFFVIPMSLRQAAVLIALVEIFMIFVPSGIANIAHLVGMAVGLLYGFYLLKQRGKFRKRLSSKTHLGRNDIKEYLRSGRI